MAINHIFRKSNVCTRHYLHLLFMFFISGFPDACPFQKCFNKQIAEVDFIMRIHVYTE